MLPVPPAHVLIKCLVIGVDVVRHLQPSTQHSDRQSTWSTARLHFELFTCVFPAETVLSHPPSVVHGDLCGRYQKPEVDGLLSYVQSSVTNSRPKDTVQPPPTPPSHPLT